MCRFKYKKKSSTKITSSTILELSRLPSPISSVGVYVCASVYLSVYEYLQLCPLCAQNASKHIKGTHNNIIYIQCTHFASRWFAQKKKNFCVSVWCSRCLWFEIISRLDCRLPFIVAKQFCSQYLSLYCFMFCYCIFFSQLYYARSVFFFVSDENNFFYLRLASFQQRSRIDCYIYTSKSINVVRIRCKMIKEMHSTHRYKNKNTEEIFFKKKLRLNNFLMCFLYV